VSAKGDLAEQPRLHLDSTGSPTNPSIDEGSPTQSSKDLYDPAHPFDSDLYDPAHPFDSDLYDDQSQTRH